MSIFIRKREFLLLVFLFIIIALSIVIIATNKEKKMILSKAQETISPIPEASPSAQIALLETVIESDNIKTNELLNNYEQSTHEEEKQSIVSNLEIHLTQRQKDQLSLLALSPLSVYNKAFSKEMIERLKKISSDQNKEFKIEKYIDTITGTVNTTIYDNFDDNTSYTTATFIPDDTEAEINFYPTDNQTFLSGTKVALNNAIRIDSDVNEDKQVLGVSSVYAQEQQPREKETTQSHLIVENIIMVQTPPLDTLGEQKILVLLACLDHLDCSQLPSSQEIEQRINNEISQFFKRDSYSNMSLTADTTDRWFKLNKEITKVKRTKIILSEFAQDVILKGYDRLAIILATEDYDIAGEGGQSTLGKGYKIKIADKTSNFSSLTVFASLKNDYFFTPSSHTEDGDMSHFDAVFSHELIHSLGGHHAQLTTTAGNVFIAITNLKGNNLQEYGNPFEIMGNHSFGLYSNGYIKKEFSWIGQNKEANIITIDVNKPEGEYTLKKMGSQGPVVAWLPYSAPYKEKITHDFSQVDQFLEYRKSSNESGLVINLLESPQPYTHALLRTILFPATHPDGVFLSPSYKENEIFFDKVHKIKIKVKDIDDNTNTLTFTISSCDKIPFKVIPYRAGNNQFTSSINIFENDLRGENNTNKPFTIKENFLIENTSLCFNKRYTIDQSSIILNQGNLYLSLPQFTTIPTEEIPPSKGIENSFTTIVTVNNPALPDSQLEFQVKERNLDTDQQGQPISKKLIYQFHVVPSVDEYKNDLEPHAMTFYDDKGTRVNHLELEKGNVIVIKSPIANNSRNPDGNKSIEFFVKWDIQDEKGNNIIPPFRQRHDGIPPKTLDDANPATLTWTIPQDLKAGDYKIILEVDSNNRLQEFNENNNMIYRYFSVVE